MYFSLCNDNLLKIPYILLENHIIERVNSVKFLGCYVDHRVYWHDHINYISMCKSKGIAMLRYTHGYFHVYVKKLIYFAYIYPYITYCLPAWGGTHVTHMNRILLLQKKAIRLIFNVDYNFHVATLAHSNNLLLFNDIYVMKLATVMYAVYYNNTAEIYILPTNLFMLSIMNHELRNVEFNFPVTYCRTLCRQRSVFIKGIAIWNNLSVVLKRDPNIIKFKANLCKYLICLY